MEKLRNRDVSTNKDVTDAGAILTVILPYQISIKAHFIATLGIDLLSLIQRMTPK